MFVVMTESSKSVMVSSIYASDNVGKQITIIKLNVTNYLLRA